MSEPGHTLEIALFANGKFLGSRSFTSSPITIGRGARSTLRLNHPSVSTAHAVVTLTARSCVIEDLGSSNGTFVSGQRIESHVIRASHEVIIGPFSLRFVLREIDESLDDSAELPGAQTKVELVTTAPAKPVPVPSITAPAAVVPPARTPTVARAHTVPAPAAAPAPAPARRTATRSAPEDLEWLEELDAPTIQRPRPAAVQPTTAAVTRAPQPAAGGDRDDATDPQVSIPEHRAAAAPARHPALEPRVSRPTPAASAPIARRAPAPAAFVPEYPTAFAEATPPASVGPLPPAPAAAHHDDDDEDDDSGFVPAFSLVQHLLERHRAKAQAPGAVAELIVHRDDRVLDVIHLARGQKVRFPGSGIVAAHRRTGDGVLVITVRGEAAGQLFTPEGALDVAEVAKRSSRRSTLKLLPENVASLDAGHLGTLHAHFVAAPRALPRQRAPLRPSRAGVISSATSFVVHVALFVWLAFFQSVREVDALPTEGRFAKVDIKDLELEPPPPPPPPPPPVEQKQEDVPTPEPQPEPTPPKPEPAPPRAKPKAKPTRAPRAPSPAGTPTAPPGPSKQAASLLSAINVSDASPSASATSVTNLDAVKVTRGTSAGFKTADTVAKLPGGRLALPGGVSDGRIDTKTGAEVAKGNVGKVDAIEGKDGPVRGTVARAPAREVDVEGELDRALVLKVVNAHMREIQGCYERKLVQDRNLTGKISFEWVITTSGSVSVVRVKFSSMRNTEVTTCIQSAIKSWSFPKPTGGNATIVYPFVFSTLGG